MNYYEHALPPGEATTLLGKVRLAAANMGRYDWFAAGSRAAPMPTVDDMARVAYLQAAEARLRGDSIEESVKVGMREASRLAWHDGSANIKRLRYPNDDGHRTLAMTLSGIDVKPADVPAWGDSETEVAYRSVEEAEVTQQLRMHVDVVLADHPVEHRAVVRYLFDDGTDEWGWQRRTADEYGLSREGFRKQLARGLEKVGATWRQQQTPANGLA